MAFLVSTLLSTTSHATSCTQVYDYYLSFLVDHSQWEKPVSSIEALVGIEALEKNSSHALVDSFIEGFSKLNLKTNDDSSWLRAKLTVSSWLTSGPSTELTDPKIMLIINFSDGTVKVQNFELKTQQSFILSGYSDLDVEANATAARFEQETDLGAAPSTNVCFRIQTRGC